MSTPRKHYRRGLVVGKFCPLHRGHMHLIEAALGGCDEVVVISYTKPDFPGCETEVRRAWLETLLPQVRSLVIDDTSLLGLRDVRVPGAEAWPALPANDAPDAVHRAFTAWLCWCVLDLGVDAVFTSEDYGDGFAAALAADFGARAGHPWPVAHVCVDRARLAVPTSGSAIRRDPHGLRAFLDPCVHAYFVDRVRVLGGESSGKTTLATALAHALDAEVVPEFGRGYWEERGGQLVHADMLRIAEGQQRSEDLLARQARRWLVCDGSALTSACYSALDYAAVDPALAALARRPYAFTFVCAPDFPFVQDGTRRDAAFRQRQHAWYLENLERAGVPHVVLSGTVAERVRQACACLTGSASAPGTPG